jgi:hypothetical protein
VAKVQNRLRLSNISIFIFVKRGKVAISSQKMLSLQAALHTINTYVMETQSFKHLPYDKSDFWDIVLKNYAYIDKTQFIKQLEKEANPNHFFIRSRKFGKSLFFRTLNC